MSVDETSFRYLANSRSVHEFYFRHLSLSDTNCQLVRQMQVTCQWVRQGAPPCPPGLPSCTQGSPPQTSEKFLSGQILILLYVRFKTKTKSQWNSYSLNLNTSEQISMPEKICIFTWCSCASLGMNTIEHYHPLRIMDTIYVHQKLSIWMTKSLFVPTQFVPCLLHSLICGVLFTPQIYFF